MQKTQRCERGGDRLGCLAEVERGGDRLGSGKAWR